MQIAVRTLASWAGGLVVLVLLGGPARAGVGIEPTPEEMHFVWQTNLARHDPAAWAQEVGIDQVIGGDGNPTDLLEVDPQPPLALNLDLVGSARFKADEMAFYDYFAHQSEVAPDFIWPNDLVRNVFGYPLAMTLPAGGSSFYPLNDDSNQIESIVAGYGAGSSDLTQAIHAVTGLIVDENVPLLGHRTHMLGMTGLSVQFVEAGAGYGNNGSATLRNYWAFHTGARAEPATFITGVVYDDANENERFEPSEALPGVTVLVGGTMVVSNGGGGFTVQVANGSYDVSCSGGSFVGTGAVEGVAVNGANREVDCISGFAGASVDFELVPEPARFAGALATLAAVGVLTRRRRGVTPG